MFIRTPGSFPHHALLSPGVAVIDDSVHMMTLAVTVAVDRRTRDRTHPGIHSSRVVSGDSMDWTAHFPCVFSEVNDSIHKTTTLLWA